VTTLHRATAPPTEAERVKWRIGDVTVTRLVEQVLVWDGRMILPDAEPARLSGMSWLFPHFVDEKGRMKLNIQAFVVEAGSVKILVDTCVGNLKEGRALPEWNNLQTRFLTDMEEEGFAADDIDFVLCTHLHSDHVGWNTKLVDGVWRPTFPKARYLMDRTEFEYWRDQRERAQGAIVFADSVQPVFEAGLIDLVGSDHEVCEGVRLAPTPGHTPGHVSVFIESKGEAAIITGDFIHHPCQLSHPEWGSPSDIAHEQAVRTRETAFRNLSGKKVLMIGTHFSGPTAGYVREGEGAYYLSI